MGDFHTTSMCRFMVATQAALWPLATAPAATRHRRMHQVKKQKLKHHEKVRKTKEKPLKPEDLSGFHGAARQIRTADLILTKGDFSIKTFTKYQYLAYHPAFYHKNLCPAGHHSDGISHGDQFSYLHLTRSGDIPWSGTNL